jgi:hypothetical protein
MSKEDRYFTAPLSILSSGQTAHEALDNAIECGIVNAGIGYRESKGEDEFQTLLEEANKAAIESGRPTSPPHGLKLKDSDGKPIGGARAVELWEAAHAGAKLLGITGGNQAHNAQTWATHFIKDAVFFTIKSDWLWNAVYTARKEAGRMIDHDFQPLSWREFRILAAILSAPVHKSRGFVFLGWESIQARSCGLRSKYLFNIAAPALPLHCQPLTRSQIDLTTTRMEANKFYLRFRYSKGDRGGKTAYSFRHDTREKLAGAVGEYQSHFCIKQAVDANRARDRELCANMQGASKQPARNPQHK